MSTLTGRTIGGSYKDLLQISNNNIGVDTSVRYIEDGEGTPSVLGLSTHVVEVAGDIIPDLAGARDIGTSAKPFRDIHLNGSTIHLGDQQLSSGDILTIRDIQNGAYATAAQGNLADTSLQQGDNISYQHLTNTPTTLAGYGITDAATQSYVQEAISIHAGSVEWVNILNTPTTLAGYGITDAATKAQGDLATTALQPNDSINYEMLIEKPTTLAGYGITDALSQSDLDTIRGFDGVFSSLTNTPTTLAGYGITDALSQSDLDSFQQFDGIFSSLTNTPTTLAGYGITDAATKAQGDLATTALQPGTELEVTGDGSSIKLTRSAGDRSAELQYDGQKFLIKAPLSDRLSIADASSNELLTVNPNDGNVGIGTTVPKSELHIESNVANHDTTLKIENRHGDTGGTAIEFQGYRDVDDDHWVAKIVADHVQSTAHGGAAIGSKLGFYTYDGHVGFGSPRMVIDQDGNVGVGTDTPTYKLEVTDTCLFDGGFHFTGNNTTQRSKHSGAKGSYQLHISDSFVPNNSITKTGATQKTFTLDEDSQGVRYYLKFLHSDSEGGARWCLNDGATTPLSYHDAPGDDLGDQGFVWTTVDVTSDIQSGTNTLYFFGADDGWIVHEVYVFPAVGIALPNEPVEQQQCFTRGYNTHILKTTATTSTTDLNLSVSNHFKVTLTTNTTFNFNNPKEGQQGIIYLIQDTSGGRTFTLPSIAKTPKGGAVIAQDTGPGSISILSYVVLDSSNVLINYIGDFS